MKEKVTQVKEFVGKLGNRTKKLILIGAAVLIVGAAVVAAVLNSKPYEVLFSGLGPEETKEISAKLQDEGVSFKVEGDSTILVPKEQLDVTKAKLVQEGYPKSGFTYDMFKDNAGMMTTDSDKNTYKLYELQDRIGATIRLFDGVKDAKVTIALGKESKYALNDENEKKSSATAVVTMVDGGSPSSKQARGIQRLVSKSIPDMAMEDVAVFDGAGNDVSQEGGEAGATTSQEIAQIVEGQIEQRVRKVLGAVYGNDNVQVAAHAKINLEKLIRESTTYTTPEKIDENDKTGIVKKEDLYNERSGAGNGAGGVAGADQNADTPQYNNNGAAGAGGASSESISREYLVNKVKEQGQVEPGAIDDLSISVAINGNGFGKLERNEVRGLVADAAGIEARDQREKITIVAAPFYEQPDKPKQRAEGMSPTQRNILILAAGLLLLLLIGLILFKILRKKKKKKGKGEEADFIPPIMEPDRDMNRELQAVQNDRGMELKQNIRDFAEENAEISAQLLKNWLNGGESNRE